MHTLQLSPQVVAVALCPLILQSSLILNQFCELQLWFWSVNPWLQHGFYQFCGNLLLLIPTVLKFYILSHTLFWSICLIWWGASKGVGMKQQVEAAYESGQAASGNGFKHFQILRLGSNAMCGWSFQFIWRVFKGLKLNEYTRVFSGNISSGAQI